jgi:hypothetical protein
MLSLRFPDWVLVRERSQVRLSGSVSLGGKSTFRIIPFRMRYCLAFLPVVSALGSHPLDPAPDACASQMPALWHIGRSLLTYWPGVDINAGKPERHLRY